MNTDRPKLKNLFEREKVIIVKTEYRRKYRINWKILFRNIKNYLLFWTPNGKRSRRYIPPAIEKNADEEYIAKVSEHLVNLAVNDKVE